MRKILTTIVWLGFIVPALVWAGDDRCDSSEWIRGLVNEHGLFVLCAASGDVAGADSVCGVTLGEWWYTVFPENLAGRTPRGAVSAGLEWLCKAVTDMPHEDAMAVIDQLKAWLVAFGSLESLDQLVGPEDWATAVAYVPAVAELIPRDEMARAQLGRDIGSSLASAELASLHYALAGRLSAMSKQEAAECLRDLWVEALK